ncbi:unnamed protein product [marine sediment metagenome]|uniref:Glycosyl transferase family 1 domain-containing protein n=1 Tax=marine sediment metagenome TaxID=412755 RepID=X1ITK3_9ZZZZ
MTYESGNADDLRKKILFLLNDKEKIKEMGKKARKFVEQELNPEHHYEKLITVYKRVIEESSSL